MKRVKISKRKLFDLQRELTGNTHELLSMLELANIIAAIKAWPEIEPGTHKYREFSKNYILKYIKQKEAPEAITSWVYFIQQGYRGPVKIGMADNPTHRLAHLQTASPHKLTLIAKIGCNGRDKANTLEKQLHSKFKPYRLKGEWFARSIIFAMYKISEHIEWVEKEVSPQINRSLK